MRENLWCPTLHKNSKAYCKVCEACQRTSRPSQRDELPLHPQVSLQAFEKWSIDFVGPIQRPRKKTGARYIITMTEYLQVQKEHEKVWHDHHIKLHTIKVNDSLVI